MMRVSPPEQLSVSSARLHYTAAEKLFSAEASSLSWNYVPRRVLVRSARTGAVVTFHLTGTDRDPTGEDVVGWRYESSVLDGGYRLLVIND